MDDEPDVERICIDSRFVVLTDGEVLPITNFYDDDGDECEPADATSCIAGRDGYGWVTIEIIDTSETIH